MVELDNKSGRAGMYPADSLPLLCIAPALRPVPLTSSPWSPQALKDTQANSSHGSSLRLPHYCSSVPWQIKNLKQEVPSGSWWEGWQMVPDWFSLVPLFATLTITSPLSLLPWLHIILPPLPQTTNHHHHLPTSLSPLGLSLSLWYPLSQGCKQQHSWGQRGLSGSWNP